MADAFLLFPAAVTATFVLAGLVKGVTGMGLPTVAMGVLGAFMPPAAAAGLLLVPSFVTNVWQLLSGPAFADLIRRLWAMMAGIIIGTVSGAFVIAGGDGRLTLAGLGIALVVYGLYALFARPLRVPASAEPFASPLVGVITGLVTGATGVFVIPAVPYLQALGLEKDELVQALGLSFTVSTVALGFGLGMHGVYDDRGLLLSLFAVIPALAGMWVGTWLRHRISPARFRRWFLMALVVLGAELALRPLW